MKYLLLIAAIITGCQGIPTEPEIVGPLMKFGSKECSVELSSSAGTTFHLMKFNGFCGSDIRELCEIRDTSLVTVYPDWVAENGVNYYKDEDKERCE
jgi:hypothetical protein